MSTDSGLDTECRFQFPTGILIPMSREFDSPRFANESLTHSLTIKMTHLVRSIIRWLPPLTLGPASVDRLDTQRRGMTTGITTGLRLLCGVAMVTLCVRGRLQSPNTDAAAAAAAASTRMQGGSCKDRSAEPLSTKDGSS